MRRFILFSIILIYIFPLFASVKGVVKDTKGEPIQGVNIVWLNTSKGTVSDNKGLFSLDLVKETNILIFTNVAYNSDTVVVKQNERNLQITLNENIQLDELSVVSKSPGTIKSRTAVLQTEKINTEELYKAACCNLSESFETNPSVDVSYSDAATGAKQIKLLGLSGTYVQMLSENTPTLRGIATPYGLGYIPGPWMESIQVSKGTASVINGYEAVTGQINVEYKKPQNSEIVFANVFASDAGRVEANLNASAKLSHNLSTGILLHASDEIEELDENKDNYMDMPMIKQYNFANRWHYEYGKYHSQAFIRALSEKRTGGTLDKSYHIGVETERYEFFLKNGYVFSYQNQSSMGFIVSGSLHKQDAHFGKKKYMGNQENLYSNLIFQTSFTDKHKLSAGASFNFDNYSEETKTQTTKAYPRKEFVPGVFAEYSFHPVEQFVLLAGLRYDYNSLYGAFVTPRIHAKYTPNEHFIVRGSAGKGYRSPNVLSENNYLLASNRVLIIADNLKLEEAWNLGASAQSFIHFGNKELTLTAEYYFTNFLQQTITDLDSNPHTANFYNLNGKSYSQSAQIEANMEVLKGLTITAAYRLNDVKTTINGQLREKPLTSRYKSLVTASYQSPLKKWQFDFTAQFNGGGRMPDPDGLQPLWEREFGAYTVLNTQITKYFRTWSLYAGSENLTNFVQQNPIIDVANPGSNNFDASMIWGPLHGRKLYIGFRWALNRE